MDDQCVIIKQEHYSDHLECGNKDGGVNHALTQAQNFNKCGTDTWNQN